MLLLSSDANNDCSRDVQAEVRSESPLAIVHEEELQPRQVKKVREHAKSQSKERLADRLLQKKRPCFSPPHNASEK